MIRKILVIITFVFITLTAFTQTGAGLWKIHPYFVGSIATNCIEARSRVYYLSNGCLFYYDKLTGVNHALDATGSINDTNISQIYYNYITDCLYIAYDDCNIDIVEADGNVVNVSAIKDVILSKAKTINDITFTSDKTYISTSFGYIVLRNDTFDVIEVRNYEVNVSSVAVIGDIKVMSIVSLFYYCNANEQVETAGRHQKANNSAAKGRIYPINDHKFFLSTASALYVVTMNKEADNTYSFSPVEVVAAVPKSVQPTPSGFVASQLNINGETCYYTFDHNGENATQHNGDELYTSLENGNWWVLDANGLAHIVNGVRGNYVTPDGISIKKRAYWTTYDPSQHRVLLCRTAENRVLEEWDGSTNTEINSWDGTQWRNITPANIGSYGGNYRIVVSPNELNTYFYCSRKNGGAAKVKNDDIVVRYNSTNSPVNDRAFALAFDSKGNLWMPQPRGSIDVVAITPEKQLLTTVKKTDFVTNNLDGACMSSNEGFKRITFDIGAGDVKVFSCGEYNAPLVIWENNEDLSLKRYKVFNNLNDQDNKYFSTWGWVYIKSDNDGMIWIGTVSGVVSFDPREAFNDNFRINRIKVNRIEGIDVSSEILLEGTQVNCISCDSQNRKWIGTNTAGIYLVSADGSEILKHFDTTNSLLPCDQIYSVCYNANTNSVLIVTPNGVVEYYCDKTASESDYSNAYAYPNPVQSTFTGYITIKGLMDNSNVVITDAAGTVMTTITSTGSVAFWDACDFSGTPVKTGIYKVYASQGTPNTSGKPITKIAVIK